MRIGYRTFGRTSLAYGLSLCLKQIKDRANIDFVDLSVANARTCDVLLISLFWWEHFYNFVDFLAAAGIDPRKSRKPLVIIGGFNSFNFRSLGNLFHWACTGDGEEWLPPVIDTLASNTEDLIAEIPGTYWPGKTSTTYWQNVRFKPHAMKEPGQTVTRIEIARGCKYRCKFCALTYLKENREGTVAEIKALIDAAPTKRVALFAPDRLSYSNYAELSAYLAEVGKVDSASDTRMDSLNRYSGNYQGTLLFGMEGVSERLRKAVGKSMPTERLVENLCRITRESRTGRKNVRFYVIVDLPGETEEDYAGFGEFLDKLDKQPEAKQITLSPFVNTFLPQPLTPVQWAGIHLFEDYRARIAKTIWGADFKDREGFRPRRTTIAWTPRIWGPTSRLKANIVVRGDERSETALTNLTLNKQLKSQVRRPGKAGAEALLRFCEKIGLTEEFLCGEMPEDKPLPWDRIETHVPKEVLFRAWKQYKRIVGMRQEPVANNYGLGSESSEGVLAGLLADRSVQPQA